MQVAKNRKGQLIYAWNASKNCSYYCPVCKQLLKFCHGKYKQAYFAHLNKDCQLGGPETNEHLLGKRQLLNWALDHQWKASLEEYLPNISQRPDLLVFHNGRQTVIEFQCSPLSIKRLTERNTGYRQLNLDFYWYLGSPYKVALHRAKQAQFTQLLAGRPALLFWDVYLNRPQYRFLSLQSGWSYKCFRNAYQLEKIAFHRRSLAKTVYRYHHLLACCPLLTHRLEPSLHLTVQDEFTWRVLLCIKLETLSLGVSKTRKEWDNWLIRETDWLSLPCLDDNSLKKWRRAKVDQLLQDLLAAGCIWRKGNQLVLVARPYWFKSTAEKIAKLQRTLK